MNAEIITIGNEILSGRTIDTNLGHLGRVLEAHGVSVIHHQTVPDRVEVIVAALKTALARVELVVVTGGLGPTPDDITRKAIAQGLGRPLALDNEVLDRIRQRWRGLGSRQEMPANNELQALVPRGAQVLENTVGSAPGLQIKENGKTIFVLPGVPAEMRQIVNDSLIPWVKKHSNHPVEYLTVRTTGIRESVLAQKLADLPAHFPDCEIAYLPGLGGVDVRVRLPSHDPARVKAIHDDCEREIRGRAGSYVYTTGVRTLQEVVGDLLIEHGCMIAVAESCTGGMLAARMTSTPGSSRYFERGFVSYTNASKEELLGVPQDLMVEHGAVSEAVALAMAKGAVDRSSAQVGVGITGIAGPDGGSEEKPVGTVHIAAVSPGGEAHRRYRLSGDRAHVRERSVVAALEMVRRLLLGIAP